MTKSDRRLHLAMVVSGALLVFTGWLAISTPAALPLMVGGLVVAGASGAAAKSWRSGLAAIVLVLVVLVITPSVVNVGAWALRGFHGTSAGGSATPVIPK